jgi:hypothetical protein
MIAMKKRRLSKHCKVMLTILVSSTLLFPLGSWGAESGSPEPAKEVTAKQQEAKISEVTDSIAMAVNEILFKNGINANMAEYTLETMNFQSKQMHATMRCRITCAPGATGPICTPKCQKLSGK